MKIKLAALLVTGLMAAGCLDLEQKFTLNPDGTGKVDLVIIQAPNTPFIRMGGRREQKPEEILKQSVKQLVEGANGVEAWKDVKYKIRDDGKFEIRATAYFKDVNALKVFGGGFNGPLVEGITFSKDEKGNLVVEAKMEGERAGRARGGPVDLTDEELKTRLSMERAKYRQMKPMMEGMMKDSRVKTTVILPAPLESVTIYTKTAANTVELTVDGKKFIEAMDKVIADDDFMGKELKAGRDFMSEGPAGAGVFLEKMFGKKDPPKVVTKGAGAAKFDFSAEVAEAKKGEEALHEELGIGVEVGRAAPIFKERNPEVLLRNAVHFDLLEFGGVKVEGFDDEPFRSHLQECLMQNNFSYDFNTPNGGSSGSMGSNTKSIRVDSTEAGIHELRLHLGGDNAELNIRQDPKKPSFRLILIDPSRELITLFIRDAGGRLRLMGFEGDDGFSANWKSADEAFRKDPGKLWGRLLSILKEFPLNTGITPAHPEMMDLCLKWHEGPDKKIAAKVKALRDRMTADDPDEREEASKELREFAAESVQALRAVIELIENESDAEAKGRLLEVAKAGKELAAAIRYVTKSGIHRDLSYLGSMLGSGGRAKAAQLRLEALTGKKFADRADFETWYAEHGVRMIWDGKEGRYRKGK